MKSRANGIAIRPATLAELDTCASFWLAMFEEIGVLTEDRLDKDWRKRYRAYFKRRMAEGEARFFVAEVDGKIVSTAGALVRDGYPTEIHGVRSGYIFGVRTDPEYRSRGLAERLTNDCVGWLREIGCTRIRLHASPYGRPIYERLGFTASNEMVL